MKYGAGMASYRNSNGIGGNDGRRGGTA